MGTCGRVPYFEGSRESSRSARDAHASAPNLSRIFTRSKRPRVPIKPLILARGNSKVRFVPGCFGSEGLLNTPMSNGPKFKPVSKTDLIRSIEANGSTHDPILIRGTLYEATASTLKAATTVLPALHQLPPSPPLNFYTSICALIRADSKKNSGKSRKAEAIKKIIKPYSPPIAIAAIEDSTVAAYGADC